MKRRSIFSKKALSLLLAGAMILAQSVTVLADDLPSADLELSFPGEESDMLLPEGEPGGDGPGGGGGPSSSTPTWSGAKEITSAVTETGQSYSASTEGQNAVLISTGSNVTVTLSNPTVTKSGGSSQSDNYSFYGTNSAVMCKGGGTTTISGGTVTTNAAGANGVFCYGANSGTTGSAGDGTTVNISDMTITTTGDGSGGIMTTYGGVTKANDLTITTSGGSSAPIRTDRGGGTVTVNGGTYTSKGTGSPAIYSVADVTVSNAVLESEASEGAVMEGGGDITLTNCSLTDTNSKTNSNAKFYDTIMLYQSFSGDATGTESIFKMTGGSLTSNKGHVFHITNVIGRVVLEGVTITNNDSSNVLISVCDDGWSGASNTGYLTATDQTLSGTALVGSDSSLTINLSGSSTWTGKTSGVISDKNGDSISTSLGTVNVNIGSGSTWVLSGDCSVSSLDGCNSTYGSINYNGHTLTVGNKSYTSGSIGKITETTGSGDDEDVAPTAITLSKDTLTLQSGSSETLTVSFTPANTTDQTVSWESSNTSVAEVSEGKVTGYNPGTAVITATANADSSLKQTCEVTVTEKSTSGLDDDAVVTKETEGEVTTYRLSLVKGQKKATGLKGTWTFSDTTGKKYVSVTNAGLITGKAAGSATLTCTAGKSSSTYVVDVYAPAFENKINKLTLTAGGDSGTLSLGTSAGALAQAWISSNEAVATVSAEYDSDKGIYTAKVTPVGKGSAKITAYVGGKAYPATVTVKTLTAGITPGEGTGVYNVVLNALQSYKPSIKAAVFNMNNASWSFQDEGSDAATETSQIVTIASNGKITGSAAGRTTAIGTDTGNRTVTLNITVSAIPVVSDTYINVGKKVTLKNMYVPAKGATWSKAETGSILTFNATDKASVTVTGTATGSEDAVCSVNGVSFKTTVHVEDPGFDASKEGAPKLANSKNAYNASLELSAGESYSIPDYMKAFSRPVYWKSTKTAVAFADENGVITARSAGKAVISATINGQLVKLTVTVKAAE